MSNRSLRLALALAAVLTLAGVVRASLKQSSERLAPVVSEREVTGSPVNETFVPVGSAAETSAPRERGAAESTPVGLGIGHLWPVNPQNRPAKTVVRGFAAEVLGWEKAVKVWGFGDHSRIQWGDGDAHADALTVQVRGGLAIAEVGVPWAHGVEIARAKPEGTAVALPVVPDASEAEVVLYLDDGKHQVEGVEVNSTIPKPSDVELGEIDPDRIMSALVRFYSDRGHVVGVLGGSNPPIGQTTSPSDRDGAYVAEGERPLTFRPTVVLGVESPEPQFDTSDLGDEATLAPITNLSRILQLMGTSVSAPDDVVRITVLGTTPEGRVALVVHSVFEDVQHRMVRIGDDLRGIAIPVEELADEPGGLVPRPYVEEGVIISDRSAGNEYARWEVPLDTSVVLMRADGQPRWQRPVGGTAVFDLEPSIADLELIAFDAAGNVLRRIHDSS